MLHVVHAECRSAKVHGPDDGPAADALAHAAMSEVYLRRRRRAPVAMLEFLISAAGLDRLWSGVCDSACFVRVFRSVCSLFIYLFNQLKYI